MAAPLPDDIRAAFESLPDVGGATPPAAPPPATTPVPDDIKAAFEALPATGGQGSKWSQVFGAPKSGPMADLAELISGQSTGLAAPGSIEDYLRTIPSAANRGAAAMLGAPGGLASGLGALSTYFRTGGHEGTGLLGPLDRLLNRLHADDQENQRIKAESAAAQKVLEPFTPSGMIRRYEAQTGQPLYPPQGFGSAVMGAGIEGAMTAPLMMAGGTGGLSSLLQSGLPAAAGEAAGIATHGTPFEIPARLAASAGTAIPMALGSIPRGGQAVTSGAMRGATRNEIEQAFDRMRAAAAGPNPFDLSFDEAINQVTGGRFGRLSDLRRVAEGMGGEAQARFEAIRAARPAQVEALGQAGITSLAPQPVTASMAGQRGWQAAEDALQDLRNRRTDRWQRIAGDLPEHVDPADIGGFAQQLDAQIAAHAADPEVVAGLTSLRGRLEAVPAQPAVPGTPATRTPVTDAQGNVIRYETTPPTPGMPAVPAQLETGVGPLNEARMTTRDIYGGRAGPTASRTERVGMRLTNDAVSDLSTLLEKVSPEFAQAQGFYRRAAERTVTPAEQGPLGRIRDIAPGGENAPAGMGRALVGVGETTPGYEDVVRSAVRRAVRQDPQATETVVRSYVASVFDKATAEKATRDLRGGAGQMGGAKFRAELIGSDANARNLEAAISQLPNGEQRWRAFQNMLDVFEATGYAPSAGSRTAFNEAIKKELAGATGIIGATGEQIAQGGLGLKQFIRDKIDQYRLGSNTGEFAGLLTSTDPGTERLMLQLARTAPDSGRALALTGRLLSIAPRVGRAGTRTEPTETPP